MNMKILTLILFFVIQGVSVEAQKPDHPAVPIFIELFTSEGCSSCPPARAGLQKMDSSQPIPGATLIVLSEHVDYWDHDGWKDPFSSASITERQNAYVHNLGLSDVYTPQIVVDGAEEVKPANAQATSATLQKEASAPMIAVHVDGAVLAAGSPPFLTGKVEADGSELKHGGDVFVAVALNSVQTDVLAGENNGKKLTNISVVKEMVKVGKLDKGKSFDQAFHI